jgi:hypothetical protein
MEMTLEEINELNENGNKFRKYARMVPDNEKAPLLGMDELQILVMIFGMVISFGLGIAIALFANMWVLHFWGIIS